ncbi:NAD(P)H-dependent oxidoreductase [Aggregatibacter actinomycetemcomitans]|uniref:NAD(P)H nitroreductase n=2 Tax=Aggregatibacter actinomycetemcomitans TaxID=714 RepID=A0A142FZE8_AGGAC|nr:NAD(P)H-dependent oxidoreductase [Aggregatibacter actinomycetemcomitans]AFI86623.1 NAD(P)H nitroreductase [Aggregatibacter actinomycetemcomitans D7S-1]KYK95691.1 NAD(P)H nitroreductase [Aggregatibacter actinomycetemcomitans serotype d str. SA3733]AMQ93778.1 NAD(P)H nitroreductase [Aggregatibacter actinomycetemcomitans]ANU81895.1 NAD(P)H-dependent oxidoreductase [Aggregatibacter actinomycetemcomitans]EKX93621.1 nitroreductase family protein [Aggregatibacter actinomycetemcomitans Y4]
MSVTKQQVLDAFHFRCATRYYDPARKISKEDFDYILELGRLSPSSVGSEPWQFLVIQNPELRQALKPVSWGMATQLDDASHVVVILANKNMRYDSEDFRANLERRGLTEEQIQTNMVTYQRFQTQHINVLENDRTLFDWASKQTYIALANMMTGAAFIGIDSCPIEGFNYAEVNRILAQTGAYNADKYAVSVAVTFGYRAKDIRPKARKPLNEIVHWIE